MNLSSCDIPHGIGYSMYATYLIYLDPPFGCQISAKKVYFLVGFLGPNFQKIWRIQVYKHTF